MWGTETSVCVARLERVRSMLLNTNVQWLAFSSIYACFWYSSVLSDLGWDQLLRGPRIGRHGSTCLYGPCGPPTSGPMCELGVAAWCINL